MMASLSQLPIDFGVRFPKIVYPEPVGWIASDILLVSGDDI